MTKNHIVSEILLFLGSSLVFISFYIFYAWFRIVHFRPLEDASLFVPSERYFAPEIEISLYVTGIVLFLTCVPLLFYALRKRITHYPTVLQGKIISSYVRCMLFITVCVYFFSLNIGKYATTKTVFLVFILLFIVVHIIHFVIPDKVSIFLRTFPCIFDWSLGIFLFWTNLYTLASLALALPYKKKITNYLGEYYFGYGPIEFWQFVCVFIGILLSVYLFTKRSVYFAGLKKFLDRNKWIIYPLILLIICSAVGVIVPHKNTDYNYYLGPVNDVRGGKTLLVDSHSQYGLLVIYTLAILFRFLPISYNSFFWVNFVLTVCFYFSLFIAVRKWLNSWILSFISLFFIIQQNYNLLIANLLFYPQGSVLRFGWWVILFLFLLYKEKIRMNIRWIMALEYLLLGFAFYWGFDSGLYVLGAYVFYRTILILQAGRPGMVKVKSVVKMLTSILITLGGYGLFISLITIIRSGSLPDWSMFVGETVMFAGGYGMIPLSPLGPYLLFIGVYLFTLSYVILRIFSKKKEDNSHDVSLLSFVCMYGILQFIYYLGRSHPNNIHYVVIPFIFLICWLLGKLASEHRKNIALIKTGGTKIFYINAGIYIVLWISVIVLSGSLRMYDNYLMSGKKIPNIDEIYEGEEEKKSIAYLKGLFDAQNRNTHTVALVSKKDTLFLMRTGGVNIIDSNNLSYFVTIPQVNRLGFQLLQKKPDVIFMDHDTSSDQVELVRSQIKNKYHFSENAGFLDKWVRYE